LRFLLLLIRLFASQTQACKLGNSITFLNNFYLIIIVNSCNVCVFYFCIFRNKLYVFKVTHFITVGLISKVFINRPKYKLKEVLKTIHKFSFLIKQFFKRFKIFVEAAKDYVNTFVDYFADAGSKEIIAQLIALNSHSLSLTHTHTPPRTF